MTTMKEAQKKTIQELEEYVNAYFHKGDNAQKEKVFYHHNEWTGWRFYLKAIRHKDWRSIKGKLLSHLKIR